MAEPKQLAKIVYNRQKQLQRFTGFKTKTKVRNVLNFVSWPECIFGTTSHLNLLILRTYTLLKSKQSILHHIFLRETLATF